MVDADFTKEISLTEISRHKFKLDDDEVTNAATTEGLYKIMKIIMYKMGIIYKRQDYY